MTSRTPFQFKIQIKFHFAEHDESRRRWFGVGEELKRLVPLEIEGIDCLHTVAMYFATPGKFVAGDRLIADCVIISPQLFLDRITSETKGRLWDSGFFADVEVIEVDEVALREAAKKAMQRQYPM